MRLESRLDVCVYRLGLAPSLKGARQFVSHGHVTVNTRKVDIPSYMLRPGDKIQIRAQSRKMDIIHNSMQRVRENRMVPYLSLDKAKMEGEFLSLPKRDEIPITAREQLVVELYSR